jgi:hypothetical protein
LDGAVGYLEEWSREKNTDAYDGVLLPALEHVRRDRASGMISEEDERRVVEAIAHTAESLGLAAGASPERPDVLVIACPAMGRADEVALGILAQLVAADGIAMDVLPASLSPGEVLARVAASQPRAVVIGSVPPGGLAEARLLCIRLAAASSGSPWVMLARWGADDASGADAGVATSIEGSVARTLAEARAQIRRMAQVAVTVQAGVVV